MSMPANNPRPQPGPPRTWPAARIGSELSNEESDILWTLNALHPKADIIADPQTWPDFVDAYRFSIPQPSDTLAARRKFSAQTELAYSSPWPEGI